MIVVLGPGAQEEVLQHTFRVLNHFGIPFQVAHWNDSGLPALVEIHAARGPGAVVFGTAVPYTDEHSPLLPEGIFWPVIKVVTDSTLLSGQLLTGTEFVMMAGFGDNGAVNAGLQAARMLALSDPALRDLLKTKPYPGP